MAQTQRPKEAEGRRFESESEEAGERRHKAADALRTVAANGKNPPVFAGGPLRDGLFFCKIGQKVRIFVKHRKMAEMRKKKKRCSGIFAGRHADRDSRARCEIRAE